MDVTRIRDPDDPRIAPYRTIRDAELLRERGLFVAEGRLVVERVLTDARYHIESLLLNAASLAALEPVLAGAHRSPAVYECPTPAFEAITGFNIHRGCLALVRRPPTLTWREAVGTSQIVVVLEAVTNADNVGGVFRNAAAFGAGAVLLSPTCCDPLYRKAIRTSMGHVLRVPFTRIEPWPEGLGELRQQGFETVALTPRSPAVDLAMFPRDGRRARIALMIGTEGAGLSAEVERGADVRVRIRINDDIDSLNLSVACGIVLSRLSERFHRAR
jgi:tRNA G18 (ribose-2'-O)-methylase SpoU